MSVFVRIAPGVVFSSDVLGINWVRKYRPDDRNAQPEGWESLAVKESDQTTRTSVPAQLPLL